MGRVQLKQNVQESDDFVATTASNTNLPITEEEYMEKQGLKNACFSTPFQFTIKYKCYRPKAKDYSWTGSFPMF